MSEIDHPLKAELEAVRDIVLGVSPEIDETIKWSGPTFMYRGNMASLVVRTKKHVQLMFHQGAAIADENGLLEGEGKEVRFARFEDMDDVKRKQPALEAVVREWIRLRSE
jgi:hypothetical protein